MDNQISIALCCDSQNLAGLLITVNSIIKNCSQPERLHFYIIMDSLLLVNLTKQIFTIFIPGIFYTIKELSEENANAISGYRNFCNSNTHCRNLMNFSRFFLPDLFTEPEYLLYIDTDILVVDDICKLWKNIDKVSEFYAVPSEYTNELAYALTAENTLKLSERKPFNAGIYIMNCRIWRENEYTMDFIEMIQNPTLQKSFRFGTQPLLNYKFQDKYTELPTSWNRIAYDYVNEIGNRPILLFNILSKEELIQENISAIHFAGSPKPWMTNQALSSGNWPSPNSEYRKYLPYKNTVFLSKKIKEQYPLFIKTIHDMCNNVLGVDIIFIDSIKSADSEEYLSSQLKTIENLRQNQNELENIYIYILLHKLL
jgi:lipopolysaccharide biosynthesis glycosyltransferase